MPLGDRVKRRRRRLIRPGDTYELRELLDGLVELEIPPPNPDPPPEESRGEPWGWPDDDEHRIRPRGWREDGDYYGGTR